MGFDTLVDKTRLECALTATAEAIREKSGSAERLRWDPDAGFRKAVEAIPVGGAEAGLLERTLITLTEERLTKIGSCALRDCTNLETAFLPEVTEIGASGFYNCNHLRTLEAAKVTEIGAYALQGCVRLENPDFPLVKTVGNSTFRDCDAMTAVSLPCLEAVPSSLFYGCGVLQRVELPKVTAIEGTYGFYGCANLVTLVLGASCTLANVNAFDNCGIKTKAAAKIYVPAGSVEAFYRNETNWANFLGKFVEYNDRAEVPA